MQPASSRVRITTPLRGGTEFFFPPGRSLVGSLIPAAILAGLCWGINRAVAHHESSGLLFALGLGVFIMAFMLAYIWTASTRVNVDAGMVTVTRKFLGVARTRIVAASDIAKIKTRISGTSSGPSGTTVFHDLVIVCHDEDEISAGSRVPDQREAEWLAARMTQALQSR